MIRVFLQPRNINRDARVDAAAQAFDQIVSPPEEIEHRLRAAADRLVHELALAVVQRIEKAVEVAIEIFDIAITFRRLYLEHLHEAVVVVEDLVARIVHQAQRDA